MWVGFLKSFVNVVVAVVVLSMLVVFMCSFVMLMVVGLVVVTFGISFSLLMDWRYFSWFKRMKKTIVCVWFWSLVLRLIWCSWMLYWSNC